MCYALIFSYSRIRHIKKFKTTRISRWLGLGVVVVGLPPLNGHCVMSVLKFSRKSQPAYAMHQTQASQTYRPSLHYADQASAMQTKPPLCRLSLCYADQVSAMQTKPLLCRPSLRYADQASAMQTMPPLCS